MRVLDLLCEYLYNRRCYMENDLNNLQVKLRYRSIDSVDCLEYIIALERLQLFREITRDIYHILGLHRHKPP